LLIESSPYNANARSKGKARVTPNPGASGVLAYSIYAPKDLATIEKAMVGGKVTDFDITQSQRRYVCSPRNLPVLSPSPRSKSNMPGASK
jgi:hypothetical protein